MEEYLYVLCEKTQFELILYTKSHFRSDVHVLKSYVILMNRTPGRHRFGVKMCGKLERQSFITLSRRELYALQSNHAKCRGGGGAVFLGLNFPVFYEHISEKRAY